MSHIPSLPEKLADYARSIASLRQGAADPQRDAYTVALGQMVIHNLIEESLYDELIALPRRERQR